MYSKDRHWEALKNSSVQDFDKDAKSEELGQVLMSPVMVAALGQVLAEIASIANAFDRIDLTKQEGVAEGIKLQGKREGMLYVLDILSDLAEEEYDAEE